jgi:hypothetical protein
MKSNIFSLLSQEVSVHWYPFIRLTELDKLPFAVCACWKEGIAKVQNLKNPKIPFGFNPVIETYMLQN